MVTSCAVLYRFEEAEADCTTALQLDARFLKAYYRRATARLSLRKLSGAKQDLSALLSLDPSNKEAREKLKIISEASESMTVSYFPLDVGVLRTIAK